MELQSKQSVCVIGYLYSFVALAIKCLHSFLYVIVLGSICVLFFDFNRLFVCYVFGDRKYQERQIFRNENNIVEISSAETLYGETVSFGELIP